jgi:hypothetical protein
MRKFSPSALLIALQFVAAAPAHAQESRTMAFVLGAEQSELAVDVSYRDPSEVDRRFRGSRLLPVELLVRNLSTRPLPFDYGDVRLGLNGEASLSPATTAAVLDEMKRLRVYTLLDRVLGSQSDAFFPNFYPNIQSRLQEERLTDGDIAPGGVRRGFVYFLRRPNSDGTAFNGVMWLEWPAALRYQPQMLETKAVRVQTKAATKPSFSDTLAQVWSGVVGPKPSYHKSYALLVGIGKYRHLAPLSSPEIDVKKVAGYLNAQGFDEVVTVTDESVTAKMLEFPQKYFTAKIQGDDRFIFYYSGHGVSGVRGTVATGYLPLVDEERGKNDHSIPMNDLVKWMSGLSAKHLLIILDSCFSGLAVQGLEMKSDKPYDLKADPEALSRLSRQPSRYLLMAGNERQESIGDRRWNGSLFTEQVLTGLQTAPDADMHRDRIITMRELYAWLPEAVSREAQKVHRELTPLLKDLCPNGVCEGDFVFVR